MILHYAATFLIFLAAVEYLVTGGIAKSVRNNAARREAGASSLTDNEFLVVLWAMFGFFAATAILISLPMVPSWAKVALGFGWLFFALVDAFRARGKAPGVYFALAIGVFVLTGVYL